MLSAHERNIAMLMTARRIKQEKQYLWQRLENFKLSSNISSKWLHTLNLFESIFDKSCSRSKFTDLLRGLWRTMPRDVPVDQRHVFQKIVEDFEYLDAMDRLVLACGQMKGSLNQACQYLLDNVYQGLHVQDLEKMIAFAHNDMLGSQREHLIFHNFSNVLRICLGKQHFYQWYHQIQKNSSKALQEHHHAMDRFMDVMIAGDDPICLAQYYIRWQSVLNQASLNDKSMATFLDIFHILLKATTIQTMNEHIRNQACSVALRKEMMLCKSKVVKLPCLHDLTSHSQQEAYLQDLKNIVMRSRELFMSNDLEHQLAFQKTLHHFYFIQLKQCLMPAMLERVRHQLEGLRQESVCVDVQTACQALQDVCTIDLQRSDLRFNLLISAQNLSNKSPQGEKNCQEIYKITRQLYAAFAYLEFVNLFYKNDRNPSIHQALERLLIFFDFDITPRKLDKLSDNMIGFIDLKKKSGISQRFESIFKQLRRDFRPNFVLFDLRVWEEIKKQIFGENQPAISHAFKSMAAKVEGFIEGLSGLKDEQALRVYLKSEQGFIRKPSLPSLYYRAYVQMVNHLLVTMAKNKLQILIDGEKNSESPLAKALHTVYGHLNDKISIEYVAWHQQAFDENLISGDKRASSVKSLVLHVLEDLKDSLVVMPSRRVRKHVGFQRSTQETLKESTAKQFDGIIQALSLIPVAGETHHPNMTLHYSFTAPAESACLISDSKRSSLKKGIAVK